MSTKDPANMRSPYIDKVSIASILIAVLLLFYLYYAYQQYDGTSYHYSSNIAEFFRLFNPHKGAAGAEMKPTSWLYISEERVFFAFFTVAFLLSIVAITRLLIAKLKGRRILAFASSFSIAVTTLVCEVYVFISSGLISACG
ncbi:hypothetical protein BTA51_22215 [Hahella sp. CCB-MM4]|uniref:hypothetical protein n=1 Tax=Hahella sp. (strain CCB-MM4) TaxID=1926491 RepID=UPI000B9C4B04|nr:hypothetical protein [Hahella sp. CCB-MM4]OZG71098.1 hypothetical protein BTA51_22215 [Hahella sp. CCB-MM4]